MPKISLGGLFPLCPPDWDAEGPLQPQPCMTFGKVGMASALMAVREINNKTDTFHDDVLKDHEVSMPGAIGTMQIKIYAKKTNKQTNKQTNNIHLLCSSNSSSVIRRSITGHGLPCSMLLLCLTRLLTRFNLLMATICFTC